MLRFVFAEAGIDRRLIGMSDRGFPEQTADEESTVTKPGTLGADDQGASAIEYGFIVGLIAMGLVGSLVATKSSLSGALNRNSAAIAGATGSGIASSTPNIANMSIADGQPGVAKLDFAAKGPYVKKVVYTGCNLGRCGMANTTSYRYADGSSIDYQPASSANAANYSITDTTGTTTTSYYFTSPTGDGSAGDKLTVYGTVSGFNFGDNLTFESDGSISGTRTYSSSGGAAVSLSRPTMQHSELEALYRAAAYARSL
ncbi:Flp family type IVb pilin [Methylobacterium sp. UNC300MFChir4.1]|uniref:Flp family type IVb pilin n=1 Tax=Methylobacterium sp. UNC300MFChir4.1 TaxID=1502747 RepID=UPI001AECA576|nr:Flp family type IVb pilin [Methylobacterium sp. UNC300MFChir4.1]